MPDAHGILYVQIHETSTGMTYYTQQSAKGYYPRRTGSLLMTRRAERLQLRAEALAALECSDKNDEIPTPKLESGDGVALVTSKQSVVSASGEGERKMADTPARGDYPFDKQEPIREMYKDRLEIVNPMNMLPLSLEYPNQQCDAIDKVYSGVLPAHVTAWSTVNSEEYIKIVTRVKSETDAEKNEGETNVSVEKINDSVEKGEVDEIEESNDIEDGKIKYKKIELEGEIVDTERKDIEKANLENGMTAIEKIENKKSELERETVDTEKMNLENGKTTIEIIENKKSELEREIVDTEKMNLENGKTTIEIIENKNIELEDEIVDTERKNTEKMNLENGKTTIEIIENMKIELEDEIVDTKKDNLENGKTAIQIIENKKSELEDEIVDTEKVNLENGKTTIEIIENMKIELEDEIVDTEKDNLENGTIVIEKIENKKIKIEDEIGETERKDIEKVNLENEKEEVKSDM